MKAKLWMEKNLKWCTMIIAAVITVILIWQWGNLSWIQRFAFLMYDALALHELEEMLTGFAETSISFVEGDKQVGFGQLCLFIVTIYMPLITILCPGQTWLLVSYLIIGIIEFPSHITSLARKSGGGKKYYPGMVTAFTVVPGVAIWALVYVLMNRLMYHWWWWIFAILHFAVCIIVAQYISVITQGMKYSDFLKGVRNDFRNKPDEEATASETAAEELTSEKTEGIGEAETEQMKSEETIQ